MALIKSYFGCKKYEEGIMGSYGLSKALLNVYTRAHALVSPDLVINACSPGFIVTDLTVSKRIAVSLALLIHLFFCLACVPPNACVCGESKWSPL